MVKGGGRGCGWVRNDWSPMRDGQEEPLGVDRFGVIFDMDGVLVDSAVAHFQSWRHLAQENDGEISADLFAATFGRQNRDIVPLLFGRLSDVERQRLAERKEEIYRDLVRARPPIVEGAVELIHGLNDAGAVLAVGSSGPRANIDLILSAMGVVRLLSAVVSAEDVEKGKPDPEVFQLACRRLSLPPGRCVVLEDAPAGVAAALAAGAKCVAILIHHPRETLRQAHQTVERLALVTVDQLRRLALT